MLRAMNQTNPENKSSFFKGCLIALGIFVILGALGAFFVVRGLGDLFKEASKEVEQEIRKEEEALLAKPATEFQSLNLADLIKARKDNTEASKSTYNGKYLLLSALVGETGSLAKSQIPIKLPVDLMVLQPSNAKGLTSQDMVACLYSAAQKDKFAALKAQSEVEVRGKLEIDEDGEMSLTPCVLEP